MIEPRIDSPAEAQTASWQGSGFHGRRTASGERFNAGALPAAHRSLPFGTMAQVTNHVNGRSVAVRINDRGPFHSERSIDLSAGAVRAIGITGTGAVALAVGLNGSPDRPARPRALRRSRPGPRRRQLRTRP